MPGSGPPDAVAVRGPPAYPELRRFLRHRGAVTGSVLLLVLIAMAVGAPWLAPYDPDPPGPARRRCARPAQLISLGTDVFGRDILSPRDLGAASRCGSGSWRSSWAAWRAACSDCWPATIAASPAR